MTARLGLLTIGQSPRDDVAPAMMKKFGPGIEVVQKGALDGLTDGRLAGLAPTAGQTALCTRLADARQVVISEEGLLPLMETKIKAFNREGVDLILLLCTGRFPGFESRIPLLVSQEIVDRSIQAVIDKSRKLGLVVPLPEQMEQAYQGIRDIAPLVKVASASPYQDDGSMAEAVAAMKRYQPDLVVFHCVGYNDHHRRIMKQALNAPIMVANSIVARFVAELLDG